MTDNCGVKFRTFPVKTLPILPELCQSDSCNFGQLLLPNFQFSPIQGLEFGVGSSQLSIYHVRRTISYVGTPTTQTEDMRLDSISANKPDAFSTRTFDNHFNLHKT